MNAGEIFSRHLEGIVDDHVLELTHVDRKRIFNLGYYTWVEQQGVMIDSSPQGSAVLARPGGERTDVGSPDCGLQRGGWRQARPLNRHGDQRQATGGAAPTYLELRERLSRRDRSLRDKVVSLEEAASFVRVTGNRSESAAARCRARPWV